MFSKVTEAFNEAFKELGSRTESDSVKCPDVNSDLPDIYSSLTISEFELDRPDLRSGVEFIGMPEKPGFVGRELPDWGDEMLQAKTEGKRIVVISTSSLDFLPELLMLPALDALDERHDVFVAAMFVSNDPELVKDRIPSNAR